MTPVSRLLKALMFVAAAALTIFGFQIILTRIDQANNREPRTSTIQLEAAARATLTATPTVLSAPTPAPRDEPIATRDQAARQLQEQINAQATEIARLKEQRGVLQGSSGEASQVVRLQSLLKEYESLGSEYDRRVFSAAQDEARKRQQSDALLLIVEGMSEGQRAAFNRVFTARAVYRDEHPELREYLSWTVAVQRSEGTLSGAPPDTSIERYVSEKGGRPQAQLVATSTCPSDLKDVPSQGVDCETRQAIREAILEYNKIIEEVCLGLHDKSKRESLLRKRAIDKWASTVAGMAGSPFSGTTCLRRDILRFDKFSTPPTIGGVTNGVQVETTETVGYLRPAYDSSGRLLGPRTQGTVVVVTLVDGVWKLVGVTAKR